MRRLSVLTPFIVASLVVASMTGCLPSDPAPVPTVEATLEPLFESDEEALAAAEELFIKYLAVSDLVAQEGGADPERLAEYVTQEWLDTEVEAFEKLAESGVRQVGTSRYSDATLQQASIDVVVMYVCTDSSGTRFVNGEGADVTPVDRQLNLRLEVTFAGSAEGDLLLDGISPWSDDAGC
jgi:hypothetical protein